MARKLTNFIDSFMHYTEGRGSPAIYRLWTAIFMIGAACERKVWLDNWKGKLYPNLYVVLVGGAGVGKTQCTKLAYTFLRHLNTPETPFYLAPSSVTKASLIDRLADAERRVVRPMDTPSTYQFNSLTVVCDELGVFLPSWEGEFMSVLQKLYDCVEYSESRRTKSIMIDMPDTQLGLLAADTPTHMMQLLPEGAWDTGFMSRTIVIYSGEHIVVDLFAERREEDMELIEGIQHDLKDIYSCWGEFDMEEDAIEAFRAWQLSGHDPVPSHPKLYHYCTRREAHLLKLCQIASLSQSSDLVITLDHYAEALDWLTQAEEFMPDVFKAMRTGGDLRVIEDCWHFCYQLWMKKQEPIPEKRIWHFLQERTPAHSIERIITAMERSGLLEEQFTAAGAKGYKPKAKG